MDKDSSDNSENESEHDAEVDEGLRNEVKVALGDAAVISDEVSCKLIGFVSYRHNAKIRPFLAVNSTR